MKERFGLKAILVYCIIFFFDHIVELFWGGDWCCCGGRRDEEGVVMKFEVGKYYGFKGSAAMVMFIVGCERTKAWGETLIGEVNIRGSLPALRAVGMKEEHAEGWDGITEEMFVDTSAHWAEEFDVEWRRREQAVAKAKDLGAETADRKVVHIIRHPQTGARIFQLSCGHTIRFTKDEIENMDKLTLPKVGELKFCAMCSLQNRALLNNPPEVPKDEQAAEGPAGKVLEFK